MILSQSRLERYGLFAEIFNILRLIFCPVCCLIQGCLSFLIKVVLDYFVQIVKPRPVQAASIPGMLGMFQIVCGSVL